MAGEKNSSKGQSWFCTTGLPTDIVIEVGEMGFHLHKFPLMSKSRKLYRLITEREQNPRAQRRADRGEGEEEEIDTTADGEEVEVEEDFHRISLPDFPGGVEIFEAAIKFCYGVKIDMTAWNVVPLRCAAEYLEMNEEFAENLVARTERFFAQSVLQSIKDSITALKSCEKVLPMAEPLGIVQRCIDAIAARAACSSDFSSLFGWSIIPDGGDAKVSTSAATALWNGLDAGNRRKNAIRSSAAAGNAATDSSWFEDLAVLGLPIYKRVISAMKDKDLSSEVIEGSLISYAKRSIPGLSRSNRQPTAAASGRGSVVTVPSEAEQRELLETVISNLPEEKKGSNAGLVTASFLFGLLRTANILWLSESSRTTLEKKIASQLEQAALDDLLMPSYSYIAETHYDVDCVERIVGYFVESIEERSGTTAGSSSHCECDDSSNSKLLLVGKLVDGYLSEIASDVNLNTVKFCDLALALPDQARVFDDGLYRAVDVYLKAHPRITEEEREKVCSVMDCQKLTLEACTHAAQNERLPLRAVVQVLFFEQLQLRQAIVGTVMAVEAPEEDDEEEEFTAGERREGDTLNAAVRENQVLRLDMDSMKSRVQGLERECSSMRKAIARMDRAAGGRAMLTRRFGCKFATQVCDSHQRTVVEPPRKSRIGHGL